MDEIPEEAKLYRDSEAYLEGKIISTPEEAYAALYEHMLNMQKEIESLREAVKVKNECLDMTRMEIESLRPDLQAAEILRDTYRAAEETATKRGDEWERRAKLMWRWLRGFMSQGHGRISDRFVDDHAEAAKWFEEEE